MIAALPVTRRELACEVWRALLHLPYRWGGNDPTEGFDCSGFVIEGLKAAGILPRLGDWTAAGLASRFRHITQAEIKAGCLLFWNRGSDIGHVEVVYATMGGDVFTIGASGGGSTTVDAASAAAQDAYIKIRPAVPGWVSAVDPF